jgi:hypothetical protein
MDLQGLKEQAERLKDKAALCYSRASQGFMLCNMLLYLACCMVAGGPVSPVGYIGWLYHCCQWGKG